MGLGRRALITTGLGLVAALVVGCGSSQGLLTSHDHDQLTANLLAVRQAVAKGSCPDTSDALAELDTSIDGLPPQTNATLAKNLRQGAKVLRANAARQCHHKPAKPPVTSTSTTTTSKTTTQATTSTQVTTSSTPTPTTPPQTTATTPPPTTATAPPSTGTAPSPPTTTTSSGGGGLNPGDNGNDGGKGGGDG
jgi:hypothetical protein